MVQKTIRAETAALGWLRLLLVPLLIVLGLGFAAAQDPATAPTPQRQQLDSIRLELGQIETGLAAPNISDDALLRMRQRLQPLLDQLRPLVEEVQPRADQAKVRLDQLGPKPDANAAPESAEIAKEREARTKALASADETAKIARASLAQAEDLQAAIGDKRRSMFARTLFASGPSILNPDVWNQALSTAPEDMRASGYIFGSWLSVLAGVLDDRRGLPVVFALLGAVLLYVARARYLPRLKERLDARTDVGGLRALWIAAAHVIAGTVAPMLASWLVYTALKASGLLPPRVDPVVKVALVWLVIVAFIQALSDAVFAPTKPHRRLISVQDKTARIVVWIASSLALVMGISRVFEAWLQAIAAGLALSILVRGGFAILFAMTLIAGLSRLRDDDEAEQEACLGPYVPVDGASLGPVRILGWIVGVVMVAAVLLGYGVFASFLAQQVLWLGAIACLFMLVYQATDLGIPLLLTGKGRFATTLRTGIGLRANTLEKIAVVSAGVLKLMLIVVGILLVLAPWGLESGDLVTSLRAAFFGFQVGGVTISLASIIFAGFMFALGLAATRSMQGWLDAKFLPTTQLDRGLRNSITTAMGYVGYLAAIALAVSALGLSLERLTLVASALSIGVGFGLQSVVSNFVSGLILLWERPIRVGDRVLVGDAEGIVKKINVRSTEIETFDRSSLIVPNSNLVSGVVRNRVRTDRTGRVLIAITVPREWDAGDVRDMLEAAANAHGDVMKTPAPSVSFKKIGTSSNDFELICFVADVDVMARVNSDLNFVIHKKLVEMTPAAAGAELTVKGLDGVEKSLTDIAQAVSGGGAPSRRRAKPAADPAKARVPLPDLSDEQDEDEAAAAEKPAPAPVPDKDESKD